VQRKDVIVENMVDEDPAARPANLAETIALLVANLRAMGSENEVLCVEIMLTVTPSHREELIEARQTLAALGYREISEVLTRLARKAKPRPKGRFHGLLSPSHREIM
jgi:hypothetical protein